MKITTIKLHETTKTKLDVLREKNETYEDVIAKMLAERTQKHQQKELIEGYKQQKRRDAALVAEWETASQELNEW